MIAEVRQELGEVLGRISDDEVMLLVDVYRRNLMIRHGHDFGRFAGNALLIVATEGKDGSAVGVEPWEPYVSGEIAEVRLPCTHANMVKPDMLAQVWSAISTWLGLGAV